MEQTEKVDERLKKSRELDQKIEKNLQHISQKIAILSGKGGVGKTTVAVNLAYALAEQGYETGLLDADIHGPNVAKMMGIEGQVMQGDDKGISPIIATPHLKVISLALMLGKDMPVIWRGPLKTMAIKQFIGEVNWGDLDFLIIDLPPGTGDEPLSVAQLIKESKAIIVTTPQDVALLDSRRSVAFARQVHMEVLGLIENMSGFKCPHCGKEIDLFKVGGGERAANELNVDFLGRIPIDGHIVVNGDVGKPFITEEGEAKEAFMEIVEKIVNQ
jgi:Mrp family chromosome partitioning ATPase